MSPPCAPGSDMKSPPGTYLYLKIVLGNGKEINAGIDIKSI